MIISFQKWTMYLWGKELRKMGIKLWANLYKLVQLSFRMGLKCKHNKLEYLALQSRQSIISFFSSEVGHILDSCKKLLFLEYTRYILWSAFKMYTFSNFSMILLPNWKLKKGTLMIYSKTFNWQIIEFKL